MKNLILLSSSNRIKQFKITIILLKNLKPPYIIKIEIKKINRKIIQVMVEVYKIVVKLTLLGNILLKKQLRNLELLKKLALNPKMVEEHLQLL